MFEAISTLSEEDRERLLTQSLAHFRNPSGNDLLKRTERFYEFFKKRSGHGLWPFSRTLERPVGPRTEISDVNQVRREGINFSSHDYLGLCQHPAVVEAAHRAIRDFGPHSSGSAILAGNSRLSAQLEVAVGELVEMEHVTLYPTGWAAGFGSIAAFVRPRDHVVMDYISHACLQQGAAASTPNLSYYAHNDVGDLRRKLSAIRADNPHCGILVVTEGLFSMDFDFSDIAALQEASSEHNATMLVDVAHDLGSIGPKGGGALALQNMLGKVDLVTGSFSKTFVANGGFLASHSPAVKQFAKYFGNPHMFSSFLAPMQAAVAIEALRIVRSDEGEKLRDELLKIATAIRSRFSASGVNCFGVPSGIVAVPFGNDRLAKLAASLLAEFGVFANLVEYPAVPIGSARIRMLTMATHTMADVEAAVAAVLRASDLAAENLRSWEKDHIAG